MNRLCIYVLILAGCSVAPAADEFGYAQAIERLPQNLVKLLAERVIPDAEGAIGRNREAYFHVRFQMGLHALAHYAVSAKDLRAADRFVRSMEYAFVHQQDSGAFQLQIPKALMSDKSPGKGDLASGIAFFLSSAGSGLLAVESSKWFATSVETKGLRTRLAALDVRLRKSLNHLIGEQETLQRYDAKAPNRLLFDAVAFYSLGIYFDDKPAMELGNRFLAIALQQQHKDGYFIERGGFDSSYNGVSVAIGYRLLLMQPENTGLKNSLERSISWQLTRVMDKGEITTDGNTRVRPGGETFLGREKDVDVGHSVEAFALAFVVTGDRKFREAADRITQYYRPERN